MIPIKDDVPTRTFPAVTVAIILLNVLVFGYQVSLGPRYGEFLVYRAGIIPYEIAHLHDVEPYDLVPLPFTLLTALFLHGGFVHLLGNMLYLWIFGNNVEDSMGHGRFIVFYLLCGLVASLFQVYVFPNSRVPVIGASGAIAGVLGGYLLLFPRAKVLTLVPIFFFIWLIRLPALFVLGFWFIIQLLNAGSGGGVAWFAHIGGFVCGFVLIKLFARRRLRRIYL